MSSLLGWLQGIGGNVIYIAVGLMVFAEDALLLGFVVPGETAAILGGVLVSEGRVNLWLMMAVVSVAAVAGDSAGYFVGRRLGPRLAARQDGSKRQQRFERAGDFVDRHGGVAIFLGRFVAFVRTVVPAIAGATGIRYRKFVFYNVPAGIIWGIGNVLIGVVAAQSYERVASALGTGTALLLGVLVVLAVVVWRVRRQA
ncbi:DedA family protein [Tomitella biformata]|uniref:DedA family protein n=1 Tax=Tomitella biformata TaxID=630403 RepID=UPI00057097D6|nr:DedA family protein [Tomitella biformata]